MRLALTALIPAITLVGVLVVFIGYALHSSGFPVSGVIGAWPFLLAVFALTWGIALFALTEED